jgi:membrane-associated protease RseP (regulator of RpoE activity)
MAYDRVIPIVDITSKLLSGALSNPLTWVFWVNLAS